MTFPTRVLLFLLCINAGSWSLADDVPIAPLSLEQHDQWGEVYTIGTKQLRVLVSPEKGAVVSIQHRISGEWLHSPLRVGATRKASPPHTVVGNWESRAWRTSEGRQVVMLSRSMGPPLSIRIVHLIEINAEGTLFSQRSRITGTGPGNHSLLGPFFDADLTPSQKTTNESNGISLRYEDLKSTWHCEWSIETPPLSLDSEFKQNERAEFLTISSQPLPGYQLPPQGWTMVCVVKMKWKTMDPEISPLEETIQ